MKTLFNRRTAVKTTTSLFVQSPTKHTQHLCLPIRPPHRHLLPLLSPFTHLFLIPSSSCFSLFPTCTDAIDHPLQLIGRLICKLCHDVVHPDVSLFLRGVDEKHRQLPVPGVDCFMHHLQLSYQGFLLHMVSEDN